MGKFFENSCLFDYSWDQLAKAFWKRYPNPFSSHVLSEDTLQREIRNGQLYSKRLLTKTNRLPKWSEKWVTVSRETWVVEESYVNPKTKRITTYTRNIGLQKVMTVVEKVEYSPDPEQPGSRTVAKREAWIESGMYGLRRAIEGFGIKRYAKNCDKAAQGFNFVMEGLYGQGSAKDKEDGTMTETAKRIRELARKKAGTMGQSVSVYAAPKTEPKE